MLSQARIVSVCLLGCWLLLPLLSPLLPLVGLVASSPTTTLERKGSISEGIVQLMTWSMARLARAGSLRLASLRVWVAPAPHGVGQCPGMMLHAQSVTGMHAHPHTRCYVENDYSGPGQEFIKPSEVYDDKFYVPCKVGKEAIDFARYFVLSKDKCEAACTGDCRCRAIEVDRVELSGASSHHVHFDVIQHRQSFSVRCFILSAALQCLATPCNACCVALHCILPCPAPPRPALL